MQRLIEDYEKMSEDDLLAEDEATTQERPGQTVVTVPDVLLPAIRQLLANHKIA